MMGALGPEERYSTQSHTVKWDPKSWEHDSQHSEQRSVPSFSTCTAGLTTYRSLGDKDMDALSSSPSDDEGSNADSVFDASSVMSSQSSSTSVGSVASDDAFDGIDAFSAKQTHGSNDSDSQKQLDEQYELLRGLEAISSTRDVSYGPLLPHPASVQQITPSQPLSGASSNCNRRRSGSYDSTNGPPCRLKRDTESADCFVMLLITFAAKLITAIWPLSACPPMMSSCFNGAGVLPLEVFIHETLRRSKTSYSTLQVALFYIVLLKDKLSDKDFTKEQSKSEDSQHSSGPSTCRAMQCGRRMFLAALMLASKYLQDRNYSTRAWSKISGLRIPEINDNETEYLKSINYKLHMKKESFDNWSKIVLSLSRLSKIRPGGALNIDSMRRHGFGTDPADHPVYSNQWWSELVKKLQPDLVDDRERTDNFLKDNLPIDNIAEFLARHANGLPTPPTSPESSTSHVGDMTLTEVLTARNGSTPSLPTPTELRAPSPGRVSVLPMRPQLRNLPTPQSTPRGAEPCSYVPNTRHQPAPPLRCSASLDALRAMRRQCIVNANLERCPPPGPQSQGLPPMRSLMRPAESAQACYSRSATPAVLSPADSMTSESTPRTSRSRSSSISSNSSWSSWTTGPPPSLQTQIHSQTSSPLSRVTSMPEQGSSKLNPSATPIQALRRKLHFSSVHTSLADQRLSTSLASFCDEGYGSGEELIANAMMQNRGSEDDVQVAQTLMAMRSATNRELDCQNNSTGSTPTPRGHKRTISKTSDTLHDRVSELLQSRSMEDEVMEDPNVTSQQSFTDRQRQRPNKKWALSKTPAPNPMDTKRMALYCAMQSPSSAPQLASQYLKEQLISA